MLHLHNLRVLILGDRDSPLLTEQLSTLGITKVYTADNIADAVKRQRREPAQVLIVGNSSSDLIDILEDCQHSPPLDQLPVIVSTRIRDPKILRELVARGCCGLLRAPPNRDKLKVLLRNYLRRTNVKDLFRVLSGVPFFKEFSAEDLMKLSSICFVNHYSPGETIINKGDPGDCMYVCLSGHVEILIGNEEEPILQLHVQKGQSFGETALLDPGPRTAYCIAAEECELLEIGSDVLNDENCSLRLKIHAALASILAKRIRLTNRQLEEQREQQSRKEEEEPACSNDDDLAESNPDEDEFDLADTSPSPLAHPLGMANSYDLRIKTEEEYEVLKRKIQLRSEFLRSRIPSSIREAVANRLVGYWTGGKLSKINPHIQWPRNLFSSGMPCLQNDLHLVVCCADGLEAYEECYLNLPLSHQLLTLPGIGCVGTFLPTPDDVERYLDGHYLQSAVTFDMRMTLTRLWHGQPSIEYLTHTRKDVRAYSLFLVIDTLDGNVTRMVRKAYPEHQIVTVVKGITYNPDSKDPMIAQTEKQLKEAGRLHTRRKGSSAQGFNNGDTFFLPDFSCYFQEEKALQEHGYLFGAIGLLAQVGPDRSGMVWGSKGGAAGALRAARARFGMAGAQSSQQLAEAVAWADNQR